MIPLHSFLLYCGLYAVAIAVPGPGIVAIVARALGSGFRATIPAAIGIAVGDLILMTLSAFGLALVAAEMGRLFFMVKLAGALYLLYLGIKYWTAPVPETNTVVPTSAGKGFLAYLGLTLGNPKAIGFFIALLPTAIDPKQLTLVGYGELCCATLLLIPAITLSYAGLAHRLRGLVGCAKARRRINKGAGAVMIGAGAAIMVT